MFPVVTNLPGGIIPAIAPKEGCCTFAINPGGACIFCEDPACDPVGGTSGTASESDMLTGLFQL